MLFELQTESDRDELAPLLTPKVGSCGIPTDKVIFFFNMRGSKDISNVGI
jgi:hypothetical protein